MENLDIMMYNKKFSEIYKGKKVFITGHTGFKGSWLLLWLKRLGADIKGYALKPDTSDLFSLIDGHDLCESVIADIRDKDRLLKEIVSFEPDYIFHLAAQPIVRLSYENPVETYETNVNGTINMLEALRHLHKPCNTIIITTDKVYHNKEENYYYTETDMLGGYDPYSTSKACAELIVESYRNSFFNLDEYSTHSKALATARAGNVIGGGDWSKDRIIPDIIKSIERKEPVVVRNPNSVRPWQHVLEPLGGYLLLGSKLSENPKLFTGAWNFGPTIGDTMSVKEIVEHSLKYLQSGSYKLLETNKQLHESGLLKLDINKAITKLGWSPKWNTKTAIDQTLAWYKNASANPAVFSQEQIRVYEQL
jgi:CDP-glucose 4,6-dehydratase